jgi:hypothetical protein
MSGSTARPWDFLDHPAFAVFEGVVRARLAASPRFPEPEELGQLARGVSRALEPWFDFALQDQRELDEAGGYDPAIASTSRIPTRRGSYHDLLGALVWLHFPATKTALHRLQLRARPGARTPRENAATLCDESSLLVVSRDPGVFQSLSALNWIDVFWRRRAWLAETTRFLGFGHGLLDALRAPHPRLMGKALFVRVSAEQWARSPSELRVLLDAALACRLSSFLSDPSRLAPLPVLGVPGWAGGQCLAFYEDTRYFQTARKRARPPPVPAWLDLTFD